MADFNINEIINSLSAEDVENLKKTAESIFGGNAQTTLPEKTKSQEESANSAVNPLAELSGLGMPDLSQLSTLAPILQAINSNDARVDFINALKPLLSSQRQQRADEAMKIVRLLSILPLLKERGMM